MEHLTRNGDVAVLTRHSLCSNGAVRIFMSNRVLLVEPSAVIASSLLVVGRALGSVEHHAKFESARATLATKSFDFVVANLRLHEFNGLHLVYLVSRSPRPPKCIVYTNVRNPALAREVQGAGAFYETAECLPVTLPAYLRGSLPSTDRRNPTTTDRRDAFRGGRRCWDEHLLENSMQ